MALACAVVIPVFAVLAVTSSKRAADITPPALVVATGSTASSPSEEATVRVVVEVVVDKSVVELSVPEASTPSEFLTVEPSSNTKDVPFPTINFPSEGVNPAISARLAL